MSEPLPAPLSADDCLAHEAVLNALGLETPAMLRKVAQQAPDPYLVDGLLYERTVNLIVGDSGIGKTPLLIHLCMAVASGQAFFGRTVQQGPVLYCDAEMSASGFEKMQQSIARHMGLNAPPKDFYRWPQYGKHSPALSVNEVLTRQVALIRPSLVIMDPLRAFFPTAERKSEEANAMISFQRGLCKQYGCAWCDLHHMRKPDSGALYLPDLNEDPMAWLQEAAGSRALVNNTDLRMGIETPAVSKSGADLRVGGFLRGVGKLPTFYLGRQFNDAEEPVGYELLTGVSTLSTQYQTFFGELAPTFRYTDVLEKLGGKSGSATMKFIGACVQAQIVTSEGLLKHKIYRKVS